MGFSCLFKDFRIIVTLLSIDKTFISQKLTWFCSSLIIVCVCGINCFQEDGDPPVNESLSIENTLWASTVVASGKYVTVGTLVES